MRSLKRDSLNRRAEKRVPPLLLQQHNLLMKNRLPMDVCSLSAALYRSRPISFGARARRRARVHALASKRRHLAATGELCAPDTRHRSFALRNLSAGAAIHLAGEGVILTQRVVTPDDDLEERVLWCDQTAPIGWHLCIPLETPEPSPSLSLVRLLLSTESSCSFLLFSSGEFFQFSGQAPF